MHCWAVASKECQNTLCYIELQVALIIFFFINQEQKLFATWIGQQQIEFGEANDPQKTILTARKWFVLTTPSFIYSIFVFHSFLSHTREKTANQKAGKPLYIRWYPTVFMKHCSN